MSNIRVDVGYTIKDGSELKFRSPVDCSAITGLIVYYPGADGSITSQVFTLADAHGNNVGNIDNLFAEDVVVKVILDVTKGMAFVQNADTNAYLEAQLASKAPAGYGLGNRNDMPVIRDWGTLNVVVQPGWYKVAFTTWFEGEHLLMVNAFDNMCFQTFMQRKSDGKANICRRSCGTDGVWSDVEWIGDGAFAPAGYGLGDSQFGDLERLDSYKQPGWYRFAGSFTVCNYTVSAFYMHVTAWDENNCTQTVCLVCSGTPIIQRHCYGGNWQPWEWVNPPMSTGVEYRTTERWNGKAVYTKMFDCGNVPNASRKDVFHGISNCTPIDYSGTLLTAEQCAVANCNISIIFTSSTIVMQTTTDISDCTLRLKLKYTKD